MTAPGNLPDRVETVITEHLGCADRFSWDAELRDDLGADSLDVIELVMALEREFPEMERISDATADAWRTADDLRRTVAELV